MTINGTHIDPRQTVLPKGTTHRTQRFRRFGADFGPTSIATQIDRIYTHSGKPHLDIFLDRPGSLRPAYLVVR